MPACCDPSAYQDVFNDGEARRALRVFRRRGLDSTAGPMVGALAARGLDGTTVIEVGAGIGSAQVALIGSGARRGIAYDIAPAYQTVAAELLAEHGMGEKVEWRVADFATDESAPRAEVVFLNRSVCCYPDMPRLVDAASSRAERFIAMSFPRRRMWVRFGVGVVNLYLRIRRTAFRVFVHDPPAMAARLETAGFDEVASGRNLVWEWRVWERKP